MIMKRYKILTLAAAAILAIGASSCADMLWDVGTSVGTGSSYDPYYYGYNNSIWNNAIDGFYGPVWNGPYRPPYRPGWTGGNPGPVIPPSRPIGGANRPVTLPDRIPVGNPEGVSGQPTAPSRPSGGNTGNAGSGMQRPGNNGRPH